MTPEVHEKMKKSLERIKAYSTSQPDLLLANHLLNVCWLADEFLKQNSGEDDAKNKGR